MSAPTGSNRRQQPGGWGESAALWALIGAVTIIVSLAYASVRIGHGLAGLSANSTPRNPWEILFGIMDGTVPWPRESTYVLTSLLLMVAVLAALVLIMWRRRASRTSRADWTARYLGRGREVAGISTRAARQKARRWGLPDSEAPGVCIGRSLDHREHFYASFEDVMVLIAGPRTGKTLSQAIPAVLDAPGAVLVTSNKRDIVDATRGPRAGAGDVWVFDPQSLAKEEPTNWWWDPLSYVTDEVRAANLAEHFASGSRPADAKTDAYFEPAGRDLLAGLILAAALDQRPITDVYQWLTRPTDDTPVDLLTAHEYTLTADLVAGVIEAPEKQRGGVYGTAQQMASCLTNRAVLRWVTDDGSSRRHFSPADFVRAGGTLYSLSKEGRGTAGPLVTALTVAVVEAAEELATQQPGGRLSLPMVAVLDEAANVCRWRDLPDLYSHYGSRGIVLLTILQSWSQGEEVWGRAGMNKLWSAANIAIYGGGVREDFLDRLSKLIGSYDKVTRSISTRASGSAWGSGGQTSRQLSRERIFEVDDLASLPQGRALILSSGNRPILVATLPWPEGPHAKAVRASIDTHSGFLTHQQSVITESVK